LSAKPYPKTLKPVEIPFSKQSYTQDQYTNHTKDQYTNQWTHDQTIKIKGRLFTESPFNTIVKKIDVSVNTIEKKSNSHNPISSQRTTFRREPYRNKALVQTARRSVETKNFESTVHP